MLKQLAANKRHKLGLLTGNARVGARHKLNHFGLWDYFPFGGCGERGACDIVAVAVIVAETAEREVIPQPEVVQFVLGTDAGVARE